MRSTASSNASLKASSVACRCIALLADLPDFDAALPVLIRAILPARVATRGWPLRCLAQPLVEVADPADEDRAVAFAEHVDAGLVRRPDGTEARYGVRGPP